MVSTRRKVANNIFFLLIGQGLNWVLATVEVILIPGYLGPTNMGIFAMVGAIGGIVAVVAVLGTSIYIQREVARDPKVARPLAITAVKLCLTAGLSGWSLAAIVITLSSVPDTTRYVLYIWAVSSIFSLSTSPLRAALQGMDKMHFTLFDTFFNKGINTLLILVIIIFDLGLVALAASSLVTVIPMTAFYWWAFLKHTQRADRLQPKLYQTVLKGGMAFILLDISSTIYTYLDALLLAVLTSETIVGYYSVSFRLLGSLMIVPVVIGQALLPTLSRMVVQNPEDARAISRKTVNFLACISLPVAAGASIMAGPFINLFYGSHFEASVPVLAILAWTAVPNFMGIALFQVLVSQKQQGKWVKLTIMSIFANLILNIFFVSYFQSTWGNGAIGASISLLITELLVSSFGLWMVGRQIAGPGLYLDFIKSLMAALIMGALVWPLRNYFLPIPILVGMIIYGAAAIMLFNLIGPLKVILINAFGQFSRAVK